MYIVDVGGLNKRQKAEESARLPANDDGSTMNVWPENSQWTLPSLHKVPP